MRADFLKQEEWEQEAPCAHRRAAIAAEQTMIYAFLDRILDRSVPGLSVARAQDARDGLISLLDYLGFSL